MNLMTNLFLNPVYFWLFCDQIYTRTYAIFHGDFFAILFGDVFFLILFLDLNCEVYNSTINFAILLRVEVLLYKILWRYNFSLSINLWTKVSLYTIHAFFSFLSM